MSDEITVFLRISEYSYALGRMTLYEIENGRFRF